MAGGCARIAPAGRIPQSSRGLVSPPVAYKDLLRRMMRKELITGASDASAGAFVETDYTRIYEAIGRYALSLLDLVSRRETTSDLVHFARQTAQVTQSAPIPEANITEYSGATGEESGEKPEGISRWEPITEHAIRALAARPGPLVAILWGRDAQSLTPILREHDVPVLTSAHPSPLSAHRGFLGSRPFSRANEALMAQGGEPVDWSLP